MPGIQFTKASRKQAKASILIEGLSGDSKSGLALALALVLADNDWEAVFAVDSENKSLSLYEGNTLHTGERVNPFNICELSDETGYKPSAYKEAQDLAIKYHGKSLVNDSISHMWQYKGGVLDMVSKATAALPSKNNQLAWGSPEIVFEKNLIYALLRNPNIHIINTVRVKDKIIQGTDATGKGTLEKLPDQPIIAPQIEFEPDLVLMMKSPGNNQGLPPTCIIEKSRYSIFQKNDLVVMNLKLIEQLKQYLSEGVDPETLLAAQHQDYIEATISYLDGHPSAKSIWPTLKAKAGFKDTALEKIPLAALKALFTTLTAE